MIALKENCVNPSTQKPYIVSLKGGRDNSVEGKQVCVSLSLSVYSIYSIYSLPCFLKTVSRRKDI